MKFNKWTLGLAALGVVSLSAATAKADGSGPNYVETALKGVSISGYVDTSAEYQAAPEGNRPGPGDGIPNFVASAPGTNTKRDGFNLDCVELNIEKDVDATPWSAGYKISLVDGPDAATLGTGYGIKQAYVELMAPVGNGLDIKMGVFDTIIGYEVFDADGNPNFTRSWGWALEPTEHTGVLLTYKFSDMVSAQLGVANTLSPAINGRDVYVSQDSTSTAPVGSAHYFYKTVMGAVTVTAPASWGFLNGSSFYLGFVNGFNSGATTDGNDTGVDQLNLYAGAVLNTPIKELTTGIAFDFVQQQYSEFDHFDIYNIGVYATYKATDKLSFNGRAEYGWYDYSPETLGSGEGATSLPDNPGYWELTGTIEYDLWANVMTRVEARYDEADEFINPGENYNPSTTSYDGDQGNPSKSAIGLYLNVIYKF